MTTIDSARRVGQRGSGNRNQQDRGAGYGRRCWAIWRRFVRVGSAVVPKG